MGQVYRATDTNLKRTIAIKVLPESVADDSERLARFRREAEVLAALNHPNIAQIYGLERSGGTTALVMELVEGHTLDEIIRASVNQRGTTFDVASWALPVARQIVEAVEAAHEQGIVHRDLKPANIKVRADGTVKVLDFGLAKTAPVTPHPVPASLATMSSPAMTNLGMILGTAAYMAPEQARGHAVDRRAEVWAFGAVLYEMLTGHRAFAGDDVTDVLASVLAREPDWTRLPDAPALNACVRRCLQRDPKQRFGDMQSVRLALDGAFDTRRQVAATDVRPASTRSVTSAWAVAGAATLAAVILGVVHLTRTDAAPALMRTMIPPPDGAAFDVDVTVGPAALSPNGRFVAFSARTPSGRIQLWVRALDATDARALDGTDSASFPFWSPDSQSIGYYSPIRGRLERIAVDGGAPVAIASAAFVRGASWGADGTIVYDASDRDGARMLATSASGGTPRMVVSSGEARSPWILPDGRHLLYFARSAREVHVVAVDGTDDRRVTDATSNAIYAAGQLLFLREGTLLAQPFDLSSRTVSGTPVPVARNVQMLLGEPRGVFSASERGLLLYQDGGTNAAMSLAWFDASGKRLTSFGEIGSARGVFLSPGGDAATVGVLDADTRNDLWRVNTASGDRRRLTFAGATADVSSFVAWSPDGRSIAYGSRRDKALAIARVPADGGQEQPVFTLPAGQAGLGVPRVTAWTRDGREILYSGSSIPGIWSLPLTPPGGGALTPKPYSPEPSSGQNARLSPNGRWVAFQGGVGTDTVPTIFVDAFPEGGRRQRVTDHGTLPVWGPDGKSLYFAIDNVLTVVDVIESNGAIAFGPPRTVMSVVTGRGYSYDVAQDGRILALVTNEQRATRPLTLVQNWTSAAR